MGVATCQSLKIVSKRGSKEREGEREGERERLSVRTWLESLRATREEEAPPPSLQGPLPVPATPPFSPPFGPPPALSALSIERTSSSFPSSVPQWSSFEVQEGKHGVGGGGVMDE